MSCHFLKPLTVLVILSGSAAGEEWQELPAAEAEVVLNSVMDALSQKWQATSRGWCRAETTENGDELIFTYWWSGDDQGYEIEKIVDSKNHDPTVPPLTRQLHCYSTLEQWSYWPDRRECRGSSLGPGRSEILAVYRAHPHSRWLALFGESSRKSTLRWAHHIEIQKVRDRGKPLTISRHSSVLIRVDALGFRMVFDPQKDFGPTLVEFQMKLDELPKPELMLPMRLEYELAQDRHGAWYCSQYVRTTWPRGGKGDPTEFRSAKILEYDSDPPKELLKFSLADLKLPFGTRVLP